MSDHLLTLQPSDVLFFRDGRPMEAASTGHGDVWPLPHVLNAALHHALLRANFANLSPHKHTVKRSGRELNSDRERCGRQFGSLQSAGPFPVCADGELPRWYFPRPADADAAGSSQTTHHPLAPCPFGFASSLYPGLRPVVNTQPPSKDRPEPWLSSDAWQAYLAGTENEAGAGTDAETEKGKSTDFLRNDRIFAAEHSIGIGIDPDTDTQDGEHIYSTAYLRLRPEFRLGLIGRCLDKGGGGSIPVHDLMAKLFLNHGHENYIIAGGQQRICSVYREEAKILPLPIGLTGECPKDGQSGKFLLKWVLLTPAIFPYIPANQSREISEHPGGWLPNWIHPQSLRVQLLDGPGKNAARRRHVAPGKLIPATLVAARMERSIPVTGWALTDTHDDDGSRIPTGGARATHLAVPAGSVYYFECDDAEAASKLAAALNWHGSDTIPSTIVNRRSTLMGEKGFGIGVCGTWKEHPKQLTE